jgi:hypothetical protein
MSGASETAAPASYHSSDLVEKGVEPSRPANESSASGHLPTDKDHHVVDTAEEEISWTKIYARC